MGLDSRLPGCQPRRQGPPSARPCGPARGPALGPSALFTRTNGWKFWLAPLVFRRFQSLNVWSTGTGDAPPHWLWQNPGTRSRPEAQRDPARPTSRLSERRRARTSTVPTPTRGGGRLLPRLPPRPRQRPLGATGGPASLLSPPTHTPTPRPGPPARHPAAGRSPPAGAAIFPLGPTPTATRRQRGPRASPLLAVSALHLQRDELLEQNLAHAGPRCRLCAQRPQARPRHPPQRRPGAAKV